MAALSRALRLISTLAAYLAFGLAGVLLALILPLALLRLPAGQTGERRARRIVARIWTGYLAAMRWGGIYRVTWHGREHLGRPGQLILVNHPSLMDVLFMISAVPEANCVVKAALLANPSMRPAIRACGYIPNDASPELIAKTAAVLTEGQTLILFPEGTRTGYDGIIRLNRGAVSIGLRGASVITPVVIRMTPPGLKRGDPWYKIPPQPYHYDIRVGGDIDPADYLRRKPLPLAARLLNDDLTRYFQKETT
jgi:acyltransferase family protein